MEPNDSPRPTGRSTELDLAGYCFAVWSTLYRFADRQVIEPFTLSITGGPQNALPVFSTLELLREILRELGVDGAVEIKRIQQTKGFLESLQPEIVIIVDPRRSERGNLLYGEVLRFHPTSDARLDS